MCVCVCALSITSRAGSPLANKNGGKNYRYEKKNATHYCIPAAVMVVKMSSPRSVLINDRGTLYNFFFRTISECNAETKFPEDTAVQQVKTNMYIINYLYVIVMHCVVFRSKLEKKLKP